MRLTMSIDPRNASPRTPLWRSLARDICGVPHEPRRYMSDLSNGSVRIPAAPAPSPQAAVSTQRLTQLGHEIAHVFDTH